MILQKRAGLVCLGVGLMVLAIRAALLPLLPIPDPTVHDEFSYLLGAETFLLGRVANPPHAMWRHFETFHVNFEPVYASKYPPGQALVMALGWKLFGHPWFGVWLSCGWMCAALCWMLQGWLPPRYALLGGLMAAAQWGVAGYWVNSYWGGAVAAGAGALVVGAVPRLARRPSARVAVAATLGVIVLLNTRPYEGAATAAGSLAVLLVWRRARWAPLGRLFTPRLAVPVLAILVCGAAAMGYYNHSLTGNALVMPYTLHQDRYGAAPLFWIMPPSTAPVYRHEIMRKYWTGLDAYLYSDAHAHPYHAAIAFLGILPFFLTPVSAAAAVAAVTLRGTRKVRMAVAMLAVPTAALLLERFALPHYLAPATGLLLLLVLLGVQHLRVRFGVRAAMVFAALFFIVAAVDDIRHPRKYFDRQFAANRRAVIHRLESAGGLHLVVVRYFPSHNVLEEWVYNGADIDASPIVWARDMGAGANRELLDYYHGRKVWLLEPDLPNPELSAYTPR